ncbi:MAG TPA: hypothetical protein VNU68_08455 [Verrucomicrobiae bacterium]|nr:hypothetical protein [Verrucomicrobiae bacterium]
MKIEISGWKMTAAMQDARVTNNAVVKLGMFNRDELVGNFLKPIAVFIKPIAIIFKPIVRLDSWS